MKFTRCFVVFLFGLVACSQAPANNNVTNDMLIMPSALPAFQDDAITPVVLPQQDFIFSEETMHRNLPDDIIRDVAFFGGLGGRSR